MTRVATNSNNNNNKDRADIAYMLAFINELCHHKEALHEVICDLQQKHAE